MNTGVKQCHSNDAWRGATIAASLVPVALAGLLLVESAFAEHAGSGTASATRAGNGAAVGTTPFDTAWIAAKPEVLTYRTRGERGDGLYQVALSRSNDDIEIVVDIHTPGFSKTAWGVMDSGMSMRLSEGRVVIGDQVRMDSRMTYEPGRLSISTTVKPHSRVAQAGIALTGRVIDPVQVPVIARLLPLAQGAAFAFPSLDPQKNRLVPLTIRVLGDGTFQGIDCYKVQQDDFEGRAILLVEKAGRRRILRIEQPAHQRVTELIPGPL